MTKTPKLNRTLESKLSCKSPKDVLESLLAVRTQEMLSWRKTFAYPQNFLRNVAKNGCQSNYTFIPGIFLLNTCSSKPVNGWNAQGILG